MVNIPIYSGDSRRSIAKEPQIALKNRYFETNPIQNDTGASAISRPALSKFIEVGDGPIRKVFSETGSFDDCLFVVSDDDLYRVSVAGTATLIGSLTADSDSAIDMAVVAAIGEVPERLFICDTSILWMYSENGQAIGTLTAAGAVADTETVTIDGVVYKFTTGSVNAGTPAGTPANPWLVFRTGTVATDITSLFNAINRWGDAGVEYSTALTAHPTVLAYARTVSTLLVAARTEGTGGSSLATTEATANWSWGGATLANGGQPLLRKVPIPEDYAVGSIATINSYVIITLAAGQGVNGQFYWIEPGETEIDLLNFATAERSPDAINQVRVFSDLFWLCGQTSVEPWFMTGDPDAPVRRFEGTLYDRGSREGTVTKVKDSLILCDEDGGVFQIKGGLKRISRPDIEERIRSVIQAGG